MSFPISGESLASDAVQAPDAGRSPELGEQISIEMRAEHPVQPVHSEKGTLPFRTMKQIGHRQRSVCRYWRSNSLPSGSSIATQYSPFSS